MSRFRLSRVGQGGRIGVALGLVLIGLAVARPCSVRAAEASPPRPNILFILADDYGIDGVDCYGSDRFQDKTPHLDALAKTGTRFERCYAAPVCGPSRCLLITGRYGFRTGGLSNETAGRPTPKIEPSVAKILKQAGYATGMAGKWRQMGGTPGEWGFDEYLMSDTASGPSHVKSYTVNGKQVEPNGEVYYPDVQQAFTLPPELRMAGATFDRFGLFVHEGGGRASLIHLDDLAYTAATVSGKTD